jgi:hypothetical protein
LSTVEWSLLPQQQDRPPTDWQSGPADGQIYWTKTTGGLLGFNRMSEIILRGLRELVARSIGRHSDLREKA